MSASGPPRFDVRLRSHRVQRELNGLRNPDYGRVVIALRALAQAPTISGGAKLYDEVYRVRVSDWRIIYLVDDMNERIEVGEIRRRTERTHRGIEDLFN